MREHSPELTTPAVSFKAYTLALGAGLLIFSPYALLRMIRTPAYRAGIAQRLSLHIAAPQNARNGGPVWIQAVSMGEVNSVIPLVRRISSACKAGVFFTTTTQTGYSVARQKLGNHDTISYFPLDLGFIVKRVLGQVKPRVIILFETELWPNLIRTATALRTPVLLINGRLSQRSFRFYRLMSRTFAEAISRISFAGMQSRADADRILALGARTEAVSVCGNVKFDLVPPTVSLQETAELRRALALGDAPVIVAGSTHEGEERVLLAAYRELRGKLPNVRLLLAPRHPERFDSVEAMARDFGFAVHRRSRPGAETSNPDTVVLLDTIGELARMYSLASVAFVGGSLAKIGGHNIIEPASMRKAVLFGPHMHHFEDVKEAFLSEGAAICVGNERDLLATLAHLLEEPVEARRLGEAARKVVEANQGATDRYFRAIEKYL
jgi:3-deoxy-D-manno-octulosonic-acid transferase